jgi:hypothetical protein
MESSYVSTKRSKDNENTVHKQNIAFRKEQNYVICKKWMEFGHYVK